MEIRPYAAKDRDGCLAIFDSLDAGLSRPDFEAFLDRTDCAFFVAEHNGVLVACGGYVSEGAAAELCWGMVHRDWRGQGIGRFLLFYRMRAITKDSTVQMVRLQVPQAAAGFYAKQGFRETGSDGNLVEMVKRLVVCT